MIRFDPETPRATALPEKRSSRSDPGLRPFILLAEDDEDDYFLTRQAFQRAGVTAELRRVRDGEELVRALLAREAERRPGAPTAPVLVLLDLNMPRKDGREALREIRAHPALRGVPVVVLTTSESGEEVRRCFDLGANAFLRKPASFEALVETVRGLGRFWLETSELPD